MFGQENVGHHIPEETKLQKEDKPAKAEELKDEATPGHLLSVKEPLDNDMATKMEEKDGSEVSDWN